MSGQNSSEEIKQEQIQAMGQTLGPIYNALYNEVVWLHAKWLEYRKLYGQSEERIDLMNGVAAFFFRVIQGTLWEDVLLQIARLTDPPKQGKFENLTLLLLPDVVNDGNLETKLRELLQVVADRSTFARTWRNKRIAHTDLNQAIDAKVQPLPGVSRKNVEDALASFRDVMNCLHSKYLKGHVAFDHFLVLDDAETLLHHLAVAKRFFDRQNERFRQGKPLPEDLEPPPQI